MLSSPPPPPPTHTHTHTALYEQEPRKQLKCIQLPGYIRLIEDWLSIYILEETQDPLVM